MINTDEASGKKALNMHKILIMPNKEFAIDSYR